jgi:hypothetical protein
LFDVLLAYTSLIGFVLTQVLLAGRFKVRPYFYSKSQGYPTYVSLTILENRPDLGRTDGHVRTIQCFCLAVLPVDRLLADLLLPVET